MLDYQLETRVISSGDKMDITIHVFDGRQKIAAYETRMDKRTMSEDIPHRYFNLNELSRYLADRKNTKFNIESR